MNPPEVVKIHMMLHPEAESRQADMLFDFEVAIFQSSTPDSPCRALYSNPKELFL